MADEIAQINADKSVLDPNHPLLEKFQKALKEHLLLQINRVRDEIFEYETDTKKKIFEKEELGVQTYELQQQVCNKQKNLEIIIKDLQVVTIAKEEIEKGLEEAKEKNKELQEKFMQSEKNNRELQNEIESVNYLTGQMAQWEQKIESQILVNQRKLSKTLQLNNQECQEKRNQDLLIYNLLREIWKLEAERENLALSIKIKEEEMVELEQSVACGNTNIEAIQAEIRCLMHSWNSVVIAISNRDKSLDCLQDEYNKLIENLKSITSEIEQVKKLTKKELIENERYTLLKTRVELDIKSCTVQIEEDMKKKTAIDAEIFQLQEILEQVEKDSEKCQYENFQKEKLLAVISKEFDKVSHKKFTLEETLVKDLENQIANHKVTKNLTKLLGQQRLKTRNAEIALNEADNKSSLLASQLQSQKFSNEENTRLLTDINKQQADLHKEADSLQTQQENYELLLKKRERQVEVLMSKLEKVTEKNDIPINPKELQMLELEKHIEETQESIKKLQNFWLREQKNLLAVSKERQEQIHRMNIIKKQIQILEQKNLKINQDLDNYKRKEEKVLHSINNLRNKGVILCESIFKKRNQKTSLDRTNILLQIQYDTKLKDTELAILQIESEIVEIEEDKFNLTKEIIEVNREALEWEKKLVLARETVNNLKEETHSNGEVGNMKQEIHRMEVIYSQMKKAQDRLIKDLTHCVSRREAIYYTAEARQKKQSTSKHKTEDRTKINFVRKLDNIRNKIKQNQDEIKKIKEKMLELDRDKINIDHEMHNAQTQAIALQQYAVELVDDLEESKTNRELNFQILLIQQRKLSMYNDLALGRQPFRKFKKEENLVKEYSKHKELNRAICSIVEKLMRDFPDRQHELVRLNNSLKIATLTLIT